MINQGNNLRGFGYSFSNAGLGETKNGKPYFAVGAVNSQGKDGQERADVVLFNSAPMNIRKCPENGVECKSSAKITPNILGKTTHGKVL